MDTDNLLISYILGESDAAQSALVLDWLQKDEKNRLYLDQLSETIRFIDVKQSSELINLQIEWQKLKDRLHPEVLGSLKVVQPEHLMEKEVLSTPGRIVRGYKLFAFTAVAASVLLVVLFSWNSWVKTKTLNPAPITALKQESQVLKANLRREVNSTLRSRSVQLEDGSVVTLSANSDVLFCDPFAADKREILLTGKASFEIAKDKSRPFTVVSGDISTTALGTRFLVTAYPKDDKITVKLFEGKVVVRSTGQAKLKLPGPYHLLPMDEFVYFRKNDIALVRKFKRNPPGMQTEIPLEDPLLTGFDKGSWYMFNNQSLPQVFEQLKVMFDAEIFYDKNAFRKLYFIGRFSKTDSLSKIISEIAEVNNLKVEMSGDKYFISKK
ncbi:MAG: FecR family protein [Chitinophagaceae bacterium]